MDNVLSNTFMFLPERLRLPAGIHDPNIVYLNMNIHASTICLHQAAILKAEKHDLDPKIISHSQARCRVAAQEIVNIMRLISHFNIAELNTWVSFNLYVATGVLIEGCHSPESSQESRSNLDFLLTALQAIGRKHIITQVFAAQLKIDLENAGISSPFGEINKQRNVFGPMGPPAIDVRHFKSRVAELSADLLNQSIFLTGLPSTINGSSGSCSTSAKDFATPPQDPHTTTDLRGILPKRSMTERLRRVNNFVPSKISDQHTQNVGHEVPKSFNIPTLLAQYYTPLQEEGGVMPQQNHRLESISTPNDGQQSPSPSQQQFTQSGNSGNNTEQSIHGFYTGGTNDGLPSNWAFGPIDNSGLPGFSGFELSLEEEQDINSLLSGTAWDGSTL